MKIRIKGNTLRYRLSQSDVARLNDNGLLEEQTNFIGKPLTYRIESTLNNQLSASHLDHKITLSMPRWMIDELVNTNTVGFDDKTGQVHLLVEKDFTCLDNEGEDQSDYYPNPSAKC